MKISQPVKNVSALTPLTPSVDGALCSEGKVYQESDMWNKNFKNFSYIYPDIESVTLEWELWGRMYVSIPPA